VGHSKPHGRAAHRSTDAGFVVQEGRSIGDLSHGQATAAERSERRRWWSRTTVPMLCRRWRPLECSCGASWTTFTVLSRCYAPPYPPYGSTESVARWSEKSPGSPNRLNLETPHTICRSGRDGTILSSGVERYVVKTILQGTNSRATQQAQVQGGKMQQNAKALALLCFHQLRCLFVRLSASFFDSFSFPFRSASPSFLSSARFRRATVSDRASSVFHWFRKSSAPSATADSNDSTR